MVTFKSKGHQEILSELGKASDPVKLLWKVLDCPASSFTVREVFSNCPSLLNFVFPDVYPMTTNLPLAPVVKVSSLGIKECTAELVYTAPTPKLKVKVNNEKLTYALLDTGAEVNVMTSELAREARLAVHPYSHMTLIAHSGECRRFNGVCEDVEISIGGVHSTNPVFVVSKADQRLLLG